MISILRSLGKSVPTLLLSFALALTVWISAVTEADPIREQIYPRPVLIELIGQDPGLLMTNSIPQQVSITLSAPSSIWTRIVNEDIPVRAVVDLSGVQAGTHELPVQVQVGIRPARVVSYTPRTVTLKMDALANQSFSVHLVQRGEIAVGFQARSPELSQATATVSGPDSIVKKVKDVRAILDLTDAQENIDRELPLVAVASDDAALSGLTITPNTIHVKLAITQRGGFRNVVVKVAVNGRVASGYRVTNISVFPPTITVFSSDPKLVDQLPGYVETATLTLDGAKDDRDIFLPLNLPPGVSVVGDPDVEVQVGIAAIEGSITLEGMHVNVTGLGDGLVADVSPETVDVILSGPLPVLDRLTSSDVRVTVDLTGQSLGTFQRIPKIDFQNQDLKVESILPASIEITLRSANSPNPHVTATPTSTIKEISPTPTGAKSAGFVTPVPSPTR
jgi:YbbR domain-containing protein